jgi:subtilisin-like proprotein convertase family protein
MNTPHPPPMNPSTSTSTSTSTPRFALDTSITLPTPPPLPTQPRPPFGWLAAFLALLGSPSALTATAATAATGEALHLNSGPLDLAVPDGSLEGIHHTITVSTPMDRVLKATISVQLESHPGGSFAGDLYLTVVHDGRATVLLNRPGRQPGSPFGYSDSGNLAVTFDDTGATTDIHAYRSPLTGSHTTPLAGGLSSLPTLWQSDGRRSDPLTVSLSDPRPARLNEFVDSNPNGAWTLFVADVSGGGAFAVRGWSVDLVAIPEPGAMVLTTALALGIFAWRRRASS